MSRERLVLIVLLILASAGAGYVYYGQHQEEKERAARAAEALAQWQRAEAERRAREVAENTRPMPDKAMNAGVPKAYPRNASDWKAAEKSLYQKLLSAGQFDVLIVPFQVQEFALDRPTRSLMTAELALAIAAGQKLRVPDPYLVARALGDGDRRLDTKEVEDLAKRIGAKKIIWGYVGHNWQGEMALTIRVQESRAGGMFPPNTFSLSKDFERIAFTDEQPPIERYQAMLPEVLALIGADGAAYTAPRPESRSRAGELPAAPLAMVTDQPEPARDALYFQLLASLTPDAAERARERFAEKSLLAVSNMSQESPEYRLLKARALMLLNMRPAALQALGEPKTPEERELMAALNGNQPDVERLASQIKPGINRVIAKADANHLTSVYAGADRAKSFAAASSLKLPGKVWPFLAARAFADLDGWAQFDNIYLKQLLDQEFPIKDYTAQGLIRGAASLGNVDKLQTIVDLSVNAHIRKLLENDPARWCCTGSAAAPSAMDYLSLLEAIGDEDLMRHADFLTQVQGAPQRTLDFLNRIESVYKGHPRFALARAEAQVQAAKAATGAEKEGLLKAAYANFFDVMYWEQGQTKVSADAFNEVTGSGRQDYGMLFTNYYAQDYPYRPYYPAALHGGQGEFSSANSQAALRNSTSELWPLRVLEAFLRGNKKAHDDFLKSLDGRFDGSPVIQTLRADASLDSGDTEAAKKYLGESIKAQPMVWAPYMTLGNLLVEQGQLVQAQKLFLSYPGFRRDSKENAVAIANYAYEAGSRFYWLGEFSMATPLYEIATRRPTGAAADVASATRLKLMRNDYRGALADTFERATHYNDSYAYRDYLGMLHAMGASKDAWDAFNVLANQIDDAHVWETVLVGHRIEGKSEADIAAWAKQEVAQNTGTRNDRAAKYLLRAGVTDRIPSKALAEALSAISRPVWKVDEGHRYTVQIRGDDGYDRILRIAEDASRPAIPRASIKKVPVKSDLAYFAEAYRAMRTGDFAAAYTQLHEASTLYNFFLGDLAYLLPYYALAAAKTGHATEVEKFLDTYPESFKSFDYFLARAIIAGIAGKTDESARLLKSALYTRPFTEERPLQTEYQYAEICELLYDATKKATYRDMALDWAQKNQKLLPWYSWPYAMEAALTRDDTARKRAIAMLAYLDPQSERLSRIPKAERKQATEEFGKDNPFRKRKTGPARASDQGPI